MDPGAAGHAFPGRFPTSGWCSTTRNSSLPPQEGAPALLVEHGSALRLPGLTLSVQLYLLCSPLPSIPPHSPVLLRELSSLLSSQRGHGRDELREEPCLAQTLLLLETCGWQSRPRVSQRISLPGSAILSESKEDIMFCFICGESSQSNLCSGSSERSAQVLISPSEIQGALLTPAPSTPGVVPCG